MWLERPNSFRRLVSQNYLLHEFGLILVLAVIVVDSEDEEGSFQDSSYDQSHQDESHQSDTPQPVTLQDTTPRLRWTQHKSIIDKEEFCKQVNCDFKWIDNTKGLVTDVKELVEKLLPVLDKQEQQIIEQRVKVKRLALQLNNIVDFLNDCRAQEEKITTVLTGT
jgi:hypothetical protein